MSRSTEHPWLNRFAWLAAGATFVLLGVGGLVTSHGAGMAVPDWPTTYGYNMFLFPFHLWTGGILYEHSHRLVASLVGFLTTILAIWLWVREPRPWLRWLGVAAFFAVVFQGILGGLRVTLYKDELGIVHAALAQSFFVLMTLIALCASGRAEGLNERTRETGLIPGPLRALLLAATAFTFAQLIIGATMRHQHAGLAIPDFPLAYGHVWPPTDPAFLDQVSRTRAGIEDFKPITAFQVWLHMAHRLGALCVLVLVSTAFWFARRELGRRATVSKLATTWLTLVCLQALLGAATIWTNKAADVATAHVMLGALTLLCGAVLSVVTWPKRVHVPSAQTSESTAGLVTARTLAGQKASAT